MIVTSQLSGFSLKTVEDPNETVAFTRGFSRKKNSTKNNLNTLGMATIKSSLDRATSSVVVDIKQLILAYGFLFLLVHHVKYTH